MEPWPHWHHCFADKILKTQCPNHLYAGDHDETQPISVMELPVPDSTQIFSSPELSSDVKRAMYKGPGRKKREETPTEEVPKPEHVPLSGDKPALTSPADKKGDFTDDDGEGWLGFGRVSLFHSFQGFCICSQVLVVCFHLGGSLYSQKGSDRVETGEGERQRQRTRRNG